MITRPNNIVERQVKLDQKLNSLACLVDGFGRNSAMQLALQESEKSLSKSVFDVLDEWIVAAKRGEPLPFLVS